MNPPAGTSCATNFVDADGDGVCDLAGTGSAYSYGSANQAATGAAWGAGSRVGQSGVSANRYQTSFVDANGDGICDYQQ